MTYVIREDIDIAAAPRLHDAILATAATEPVDVISLDMRDVRFMDAAGLHLCEQLAHETGRPVRVHHARPNVRMVFELTGFADLLADADAEPAVSAN